MIPINPMERLWGYHCYAPPFKQIKNDMREAIVDIEKHKTIEKPDYIPPPTCQKCGNNLEICKGIEPYSVDHLSCPKCDSTYVISEKPIEKDTSEAFKNKSKKDNSRSNTSAMAKMEKKL